MTPDDIDHAPGEIDNELSALAPLISFSLFDSRYTKDDVADIIDDGDEINQDGELNVNVTKLS